MNRRGLGIGWNWCLLVGVIIGGIHLVARGDGARGDGADDAKPVTTQSFMRGKLQHSQKIIEGIALENFDLITQHAQEMSLLSLESHWNVLRTQKYVDQSAEFRHAIDRLVDAAKAKDMDATALAYMDMTLKCIHCHKYVRSQDGRAKESIGRLPPGREVVGAIASE